MPLLLLLLLMTACLPVRWPEPVAWSSVRGFSTLQSSRLTMVAVGVVLAANLLAAYLLAQRTCRRLEHHPEQRETIARAYLASRTLHFFGQMACFALMYYPLGWGWLVQCQCQIEWQTHSILAPGAELLLLLPYLLMLLGGWIYFYDADRAFHHSLHGSPSDKPFWTRGGYCIFHLRQYLILLMVPLGLLTTQQSLHRLWPTLGQEDWFHAVSLALMPAIVIFMPWALRYVLGLRSLPAGPIRDRLLAVSQRTGFRCADILLWNTRSTVANALIVGVLPSLRYVVLTDRLIEELTPDEICTVFGHELGHVRHGHFLLYLAFLTLSLLLLGALLAAIEQALTGPTWEQLRRDYEILLALPPVVILGIYLFVTFGYLSRRCERQADIYGCRAMSCERFDCTGHDATTRLAERGQGLCITGIRTFIAALERVEKLHGPRSPSQADGASWLRRWAYRFRQWAAWLRAWQHSTVRARVAWLEQVIAQPEIERRFQRRLAWTKWLGMLALLSGVIGVGLGWGWQWLWKLM